MTGWWGLALLGALLAGSGVGWGLAVARFGRRAAAGGGRYDPRGVQEAVSRREAILEAISLAATRFLRESNLPGGMAEVLENLGRATAADRVYIFENHRDDEGRLRTSQRFEWVASGVQPEIDNPDLQEVDLVEVGYARWIRVLETQRNVHGLVREFPPDERPLLEAQGIVSIVVVPIFVGAEWWGFMGFDDCRSERRWSAAEIDALGAAAGILGAAIQHRRAEEALASHRDRLEDLVRERTGELEEAQEILVRQERLAALGQLTGSISHELRNPLATIRSSCFLISERLRGEDLGVERALERVERNVERCDRIIQEMLDFARIRQLHCEPTEIDPWLEQLLDEQEIPPGVTLERRLGAGVSVGVDREKMRRAFVNLIINAFQAMAEQGEGGRLTVSTRLRGEERVEIRVADTGPGIEAENLEKVFEPLYSTKSFGVGLGLPIVRQILELHEGGIELRAAAEGGTEAVLWLPLPGCCR